MAEAMAYASTVATQGASAEAPIPTFEPIFAEESTQAERVVTRESAPILTKIPTPQKGVTPAMVSQTENTSLTTSFVIFATTFRLRF